MGMPRLLALALAAATTATVVEHSNDREELLNVIQKLSNRLEVLEARAAEEDRRQMCSDKFPVAVRNCDGKICTELTFGGCNRNMMKNTTLSAETCMNGTMSMYNLSTAPKSKHLPTTETGLFDAKIHMHYQWPSVGAGPSDIWWAGDVYNFLCTYTIDEPHFARCTLTYEEPARPQGGAYVTLNFNDVSLATPEDGLPQGSCVAGAATITGNYFYDSEMVAAGVYSFYAPVRKTASRGTVLV